MTGDKECYSKYWIVGKQHSSTLTCQAMTSKQSTIKHLLIESLREQANTFLNFLKLWKVGGIKQMENNKLKDLISKVQKWFYDRNLHTQEPNKQFLKLYEEIGELSRGIAEKDEEVTKDSIGDITVVLIGLTLQLGINTKEIFPEQEKFIFSEAAKTEDYFVLMMDQALASYFNRQGYQLKSVVHELMRISQMLNYDFVECLNKAYEEIKDRKGKLVDGIWIKEERLK
nr:MAG TPA: NTP-PPase-like protein [Caudoviricetes sp.]